MSTLTSLHSTLTAHGLIVADKAKSAAGKICPVAPPGAQAPVNQMEGYVLWGVLTLFAISVFVALGAVIAGRVFGMPHASKVGVISIVVVFISAIAYLILPGMISGITGKGCV